MDRSTYNKLYEQVKRHEGFVKEVYVDSLGFPTAGVGHLLTRDDPDADDPIWRDERFLLDLYEKDLDSHIEDAIYFVGKRYFDDLPEQAQLMICDLAFNLGARKLAKWKNLRKNLRAHNWPGVIHSLENSRWYRQVGRRSKNLIGLIRELID